MAGVNKAILLGHLGGDPKITATRSGAKVASFSLATSKSWKDKESGERRETTEWHRVVIYNERLLNVAREYLKKGSKVYVEGEIRTRKYTGTDGVERSTTEIVLANFGGDLTLLESKREAPEENAYGTTRARDQAAGAGPAPRAAASGPDPDDDIPF